VRGVRFVVAGKRLNQNNSSVDFTSIEKVSERKNLGRGALSRRQCLIVRIGLLPSAERSATLDRPEDFLDTIERK